MTMKDQAAIAGIGFTPYYKRGESLPLTETQLACQAILSALDDAGLTIKDLDGFALYSQSVDPATIRASGSSRRSRRASARVAGRTNRDPATSASVATTGSAPTRRPRAVRTDRTTSRAASSRSAAATSPGKTAGPGNAVPNFWMAKFSAHLNG